MFSGLFGGNTTQSPPLKDSNGSNPLKALEERLRLREGQMDQCIDQFDDLIRQFKKDKPLSPANYKKLEEVKESKTDTTKPADKPVEIIKGPKVPKKSEWHLTLNSVLETIVQHADAQIKTTHDALSQLDISQDAKDEENYVRACELSKELSAQYKNLLNEICIFLLECRTGEEVMKNLVTLLNVSKVDELFDRGLYRHIQKTTKSAEDYISKGLRDLDKTRTNLTEQLKLASELLTKEDEESVTLKPAPKSRGR